MEKKIISLEISNDMLFDIRKIAQEKQLSVSAIIRLAIIDYLSMLKKQYGENK